MTSAADAAVLPEGFRFGVATAGFQVEGHFNGPGEPRNNWYGWERDGRVEPSGIAVDFWDRYEDHLDRAVAAGCNGFGLSLEWARCEPAEQEWDDDAFKRYAAILDACRERGLEPLVTLHHFTHPWWLGENFWLHLDSPARYAAWVTTAVERLGDRVQRWVTLNEINVLAVQMYLTGLFSNGTFPPGGRLRVGNAVRALDHLLAAHVFGYNEIHRLRSDAVVSTNTFTFSIYELDRLLHDVLLARFLRVPRADLGGWLAERRAAFGSDVGPVAGRELFLRRWTKRAIPLDRALPRAVAAVYDSPHGCTLDVTQVSSKSPAPGPRCASGPNRLAPGLIGQGRPDPAAFKAFSAAKEAPGRALWIVSNGMCNRVRGGRSYPRADGWTRPRYIREHLRSMVELIDSGRSVGGYYHWSLVDDYGWGTYEPRSGLFGVDRDRGVRWSRRDAMGHDAAGTYRRIIEGLRAGDRSVLVP